MKRAIILLLLFVVSLGVETFANTGVTAEDPRPKYGARKSGKRLGSRFFKVKVSRFNGKIRTKHDNQKKKALGKKKNKIKAHRPKKRRFKALYN